MNLKTQSPQKIRNLAGKARDVQRLLERLNTNGNTFSITISSEELSFDIFENGIPVGGAVAMNERDFVNMIQMSLSQFDPLDVMRN